MILTRFRGTSAALVSWTILRASAVVFTSLTFISVFHAMPTDWWPDDFRCSLWCHCTLWTDDLCFPIQVQVHRQALFTSLQILSPRGVVFEWVSEHYVTHVPARCLRTALALQHSSKHSQCPQRLYGLVHFQMVMPRIGLLLHGLLPTLRFTSRS